MITPQSNELIRLFGFYRQGMLALSGGVCEQPAKYIEAMRLIESQVKSE